MPWKGAYLKQMWEILYQVPASNSDLSGMPDSRDDNKINENSECHLGWFVLFMILHLWSSYIIAENGFRSFHTIFITKYKVVILSQGLNNTVKEDIKS